MPTLPKKLLLKHGLIVTALSITIAGCSKQPTPEQTLINTELDRVIVPIHQHFEEQTAQLSQQATAFCSDQRNPDSLETLREQWLLSMQSWQQVMAIDFGPIKEHNQAWKIQFWPDKKNLIKQKTLKLLASDSKIDGDKIEKASVVIQGLSATEYLLYDRQSLVNAESDFNSLYDTSTTQGQRRCDMLMAVTDHSHRVAQHMAERWVGNDEEQGYADIYRSFGEDNVDYPTANDAIGTLIQSMVSSLEKIKKDKIGGPLGYNAKTKLVRPYLVEAWRSQQSLQLIDANLEAIDQLLNAGLLEYISAKPGGAELAAKIKQQLADTQFAASVIKQSLFEAVNDADGKAQTEDLYRQVTLLLRLLKKETVDTLGITLGFNSNDGD
ncbi:hypothetical protein EDC56_2586 [Sinobacterium caligoides]|uniref:Imelysin-like domain-containing protein n=1 Tax=Sinobacterium caligoides TaxID=933926 RepID=A0A3N2DJV8_9GAMM|nr:imelysin family protein [Sinobacterium caligoides]ROR99951.1 hypothetical protein EDC56_2586 [Sinobacterium caligoides]